MSCQYLHQQWFRIALIGGLLLPICLNYYTPTWNAILKHLPILKNSTSLIRWISLYIPVVIVLTALAGQPCCAHQPSIHMQWSRVWRPWSCSISGLIVSSIMIKAMIPARLSAYNEVQLHGGRQGLRILSCMRIRRAEG